MNRDELQARCEAGQAALMETRYIEAEQILAAACDAAQKCGDWDTLWRVILPLQEARRQRRQRCGEGVVRLDIAAKGPDDRLDPVQLIEQFPHGQLLIAGWESIAPAVEFRRLAAERRLYVETFLGAVLPGDVTVIVPLENEGVGGARSIALGEGELAGGECAGTPESYSRIMMLWERLHGPFLREAEGAGDGGRRMAGYFKVIEVDYACELAHQGVGKVARGWVAPRAPQAGPLNGGADREGMLK